MPTFDVTIQGKRYHVEVPDPGASPLQVVVDGQAFDVEISGTGMNVHPTQLAQAPRPAPEPPSLPPMAKVNVARPVAPITNDAPSGGHDVTAPMPGTILSVEVKAGEPIEAGQVVCILEAMKMKNPIRASFAGTVSEIAVTPGQSVAYGHVLLKVA